MKTTLYTLDEAGEPVPATSASAWDRWLNRERRQVARTKVAPGVVVSTVFLGIDHGYGGGPPVLWESMIFGGPLDQDQERYTSRAAAEAGHAAMVTRARDFNDAAIAAEEATR